MTNYLNMAHKQQIQALLALGWSHRRIQKETGINRETVARYAKLGDSKPAKVPAGSELGICSKSQAAAYHDFILVGIEKDLTAQRIYEDIVLEQGYGGSYDSVLRYCRGIKKTRVKAVGVMHTPPGEEAQVDFLSGPPTLDPSTGAFRRTHIFIMTLCFSRHWPFQDYAYVQEYSGLHEPSLCLHLHWQSNYSKLFHNSHQ